VAANDAAPTQRRIPMSKLTDTQLIILSAASQRDDRGVELPANVKGGAARKVVDKLIRGGLLEEVRAVGSFPVWRRDDESGPMALRITKTGLKARKKHRPGKAKTKAGSLGESRPGSKQARVRSMSRMRRRPLPRRPASEMLPPAKSRYLHPKLLPPGNGFPWRHRIPLASSRRLCRARASRGSHANQ
jgi:hypothetical protein